ncbi:hypothetical protein APR08_002564 [Nocardia amikacinitolerans]|nr:hypothetical protein [Nocardia amikacinitolerans]
MVRSQLVGGIGAGSASCGWGGRIGHRGCRAGARTIGSRRRLNSGVPSQQRNAAPPAGLPRWGMMGAMDIESVRVDRLGPDEWRRFRRIRLLALAEAPYAFGSTLASAQARTDREWRELLAARTQFLATAGDHDLGTIGAVSESNAAHLISMWVDPKARGTACSRSPRPLCRRLGNRDRPPRYPSGGLRRQHRRGTPLLPPRFPPHRRSRRYLPR